MHQLLRTIYQRAKASPWIRSVLRNPTIARWKAALACRLMARDAEYEAWLVARRQERASRGYGASEPGLLTFLTTVWNTPPEFLDAMATSLLGQSPHADFEWVLLDNGSHRGDTRASLKRIASDPRVRFHRGEDNLGIIGGMRFCLERATGRYVLPVDSDDLLEPDAVAVITAALRQANYPAIAYTDEDHLLGNKRVFPYFKPDWDPVLFFNSAYIAHLGVISREEALRVGVYSDSGANGCHDWDTFERFLAAGHTPLHIPEITYSWRMHAQSTAANVSSKSYIHSSHRGVLERARQRLPRPDRFAVELSPLFSGTPDWWFRRLPVDPPRILLITLGESEPVDALAEAKSPAGLSDEWDSVLTHRRLPLLSGRSLQSALEDQPDVELVAIVDAAVRPQRTDWLWEAVGLFERFPQADLVGGRLVDDGGRVLAAGYQAFRAENGSGSWRSPDAGRLATDSGYFAQMWKQRSVSGVPLSLSVMTTGLAKELARRLDTGPSPTHAACAAAALASHRGRIVLYSPFLTATAPSRLAQPLDGVAVERLAKPLANLALDRRWYPEALAEAIPYRPAPLTGEAHSPSSAQDRAA